MSIAARQQVTGFADLSFPLCSNFDVALANLGNAIKDQGRTQDSVQYYRRAVKVNPNFPEALCGLVSALLAVCDDSCTFGCVDPFGVGGMALATLAMAMTGMADSTFDTGAGTTERVVAASRGDAGSIGELGLLRRLSRAKSPRPPGEGESEPLRDSDTSAAGGCGERSRLLEEDCCTWLGVILLRDGLVALTAMGCTACGDCLMVG